MTSTKNFTFSIPYRFGFNGKEQDFSIATLDGANYNFGAREYDSRIGRWWAVDEKAAKYPGLSPYNFCANNPIKFVDKDGKDIWIHDPSNKDAKPILYVPNKTDISKASAFVKQAVTSLNVLYSTDAGKKELNVLVNTNTDYNLVKEQTDMYNPKTKEIQWNPDNEQFGKYEGQSRDEKGERSNPKEIKLGHELHHAFDDEKGELLDQNEFNLNRKENSFINEEKAIHQENKLRAALNYLLRKGLGDYNMVKDGKKIEGENAGYDYRKENPVKK